MSNRIEEPKFEELTQHSLIGICWVLTSRCPLECPKCFGIQDLNDGQVEQQKQMIDIIAGCGVRKLTFAGGEPLLVPHVIDLIKYAHGKGLNTALFTSGMGLTDAKIKTLDHGILTHLAIPLEGSTPEVHQRVMGRKVPGHFDIVMELLPKVVNRTFNLEISTVVTGQNIDDLTKMGLLLQKHNVPKWKLFQFYPLGRGYVYRREFEIPQETFLERTQQVRDLFPGIDIDIQCGNLEKQASYFNLGPRGEVFTTIGHRYEFMGNIFERPPLEIWQDPRFAHKRHSQRHWRDV